MAPYTHCLRPIPWVSCRGALGPGPRLAGLARTIDAVCIRNAATEPAEKKQLRSAVHALRFAATVAIIASAAGYTKENEWLDLINIALWILVVALIECKLLLPQRVARNRRLFIGVAVALYSAIALLIPLWALRGQWFDAYDAALWLIAFALIEKDALKLAG